MTRREARERLVEVQKERARLTGEGRSLGPYINRQTADKRLALWNEFLSRDRANRLERARLLEVMGMRQEAKFTREVQDDIDLENEGWRRVMLREIEEK